MKPYALATLETVEPVRPLPQVPIETIIHIVAEYMRIDRYDIGRPTRHPRVVRARELIVYFARRHTTFSTPKLAEFMGRPNHSSVLTMHKRIIDNMNEERVAQIADLTKMLVPPTEGEYAN